MRLLFIYFYENFGTFEKGSIIHLSKKYKFTLDKEKSTEKEFYFNKEENPNFIEDFYSENIDIGVLIGENGTGKSVLLNSIRDKKNDYSICVYEEENNEFYLLENDLFKIKENEYYERNNIPFEENENFIIKIDDKKISKKRNLKSIYYSSILEKINENLNDDFDVSNMYLLNKIDENNLEKKLELLEISDLHKMNNFKYDIKTDISKTFFEDAKEFIKDSYILLFEKTMEILNKNKDYEKIEQIFNKLPKFILDDINKYLDENDLLFDELKVNQVIVNNYIEECNKDIYNFLKENNINIDEEFIKMDKKIENNEHLLFSKDLLYKLSEIDFDITKLNVYNIIDYIKNLFPMKSKSNGTSFTDAFKNKMFQYLYFEKIFQKCLIKVRIETDKKDVLKIIFNIFKINYLRKELNCKKSISMLFIKNKFKDILLFDKKSVYRYSSSEGEKFIDYKEKTIIEIKQIIENNYLLFYNSVINDVENLDDKILVLLILKELEQFERIDKEKEKSKSHYKAIYSYLVKLLKIKNIDSEEKKELLNIFYSDESLRTSLLIIYHKYNDFKINEPFNFDKYNEFIKDTIHPFSFIFSPPISSGQKAKEIINARINDAIQKINEENPNENILILLDEADLKLHLEWQRQFLYDLIKFLNSCSNNKFYVLYATHSPMILSDITNDRVVFLKKKDEKYSEDKQDFTKNTFGANIYDIYADSFFVDDFMGKFAQNKINGVIDLIESHKKDKQTISKNQVPNLLKIVKNIGEPLLRNKLEDDIKFLFDIKDDISQIADTLKDKNFEEIKQELNKYSQDKQKEILEKLFGNQND